MFEEAAEFVELLAEDMKNEMLIRAFNLAKSDIQLQRSSYNDVIASSSVVDDSFRPGVNKISQLTLDDFEFNEETKTLVAEALYISEMDFAHFVKQAVKVSAKTIYAKYRSNNETLAFVSTGDLLDNVKYSTNPNRPEELIKRAIWLIADYNDHATDKPEQRWIITPSLLHRLTGSRVSRINELVVDYQDKINSHHAKYPEFFEENGSLNYYFNRKSDTSIFESLKKRFVELPPGAYLNKHD